LSQVDQSLQRLYADQPPFSGSYWSVRLLPKPTDSS
jgi:hypothetical protein